MVCRYSEPRQHGHREPSAGKPLRQVIREIAEVNLSCGERVITGDPIAFVEQDLCNRQVFLLLLPGLRAEPIVDFLLTATELPARMIAL